MKKRTRHIPWIYTIAVGVIAASLILLNLYSYGKFDTNTNRFIYYFSIAAISIAFIFLYYTYINNKHSTKITDREVITYINNNFSEYSIETEITPNNINKTFLLSKYSDKYILKVACRNKKT